MELLLLLFYIEFLLSVVTFTRRDKDAFCRRVVVAVAVLFLFCTSTNAYFTSLALNKIILRCKTWSKSRSCYDGSNNKDEHKGKNSPVARIGMDLMAWQYYKSSLLHIESLLLRLPTANSDTHALDSDIIILSVCLPACLSKCIICRAIICRVTDVIGTFACGLVIDTWMDTRYQRNGIMQVGILA